MTNHEPERMIALIKAIQEIEAATTMPELSQKTGISHAALHRAINGKTRRLRGSNLEALITHLAVSEAELESYFIQGNPSLDELLESLCRRVAENQSQQFLDRQSGRLLKEFLDRILPRLNFWDLVQASQEVSYRLWAKLNQVVPGRNTIAALLQEQDLQQLAEDCHLSPERLQRLSQGDRPEYHELTMLATVLNIDFQVLVAMRDRIYDDKPTQIKPTQRKKNGTPT